MTESKIDNEFEVAYRHISEFRRNMYKEQIGSINFCDFEIDVNIKLINFIKNSIDTDAISKKAGEFYIFEIGLNNATLIEERKKYHERPLGVGKVFSPKYTAIIKNGFVI